MDWRSNILPNAYHVYRNRHLVLRQSELIALEIVSLADNVDWKGVLYNTVKNLTYVFLHLG